MNGGEQAKTPLNAGTPTRLRELGYDERWLQDWLSAGPERLGLGEVKVLAQELHHSGGGALDILAADGDVYYSIEVQLGEIDANHGFRVLDYWARNKDRFPDKTHVAVLMAESAAGRYEAALRAIAENLPLVVIELRAWRGESEAVLVPEVVVANDSLDIGGTARPGATRTEADWREECTPETWAFHEQFIAWTREHLGDVAVDYGPKSYIGVRRGRRVWAPLWPRQDGAGVYLPDPDGSREEESVAFEQFRARFTAAGLELSWAARYNAGANPITLRLRRPDLERAEVQDLLRASWEILDPGQAPWSERNPVSAAVEAPGVPAGDGVGQPHVTQPQDVGS